MSQGGSVGNGKIKRGQWKERKILTLEVKGSKEQKVTAGVQTTENAFQLPIRRLLHIAIHQLLCLMRYREVNAAHERCVREVLCSHSKVLRKLNTVAGEDPDLSSDFILGAVIHQRVDALQGLENPVSIHQGHAVLWVGAPFQTQETLQGKE